MPRPIGLFVVSFLAEPWEKTDAEELEHYLGLCLGREGSLASAYPLIDGVR